MQQFEHIYTSPIGKIKIQEKIYGAESRGEYLEKGSTIKVISKDSNL